MDAFEKNTIARIEKFFHRLGEKYYVPLADLNCTAYVTKEPLPYSERMVGEQKELRTGDHWGELFDCAWFHFTGTVPEGYGKEELVLLLDISGEGLCWDEEEGPLIGLTHGSVVFEYGSVRKHTVPLELLKIQNGKIDLWVDGGCNDLFGRYIDSGDLKEACIARVYPELRGLYYDFFVLKEAFENLQNGPRRSAIIHAMNCSMNVMYDYTEEEAVKARKILSKELEKKGGTPSLTVNFIGHSHIDLAWLWPIRETVRKGARTFATADRMMDRFQDYRFGASQPQLFAWMKEYYPKLYQKIKKRVSEKRLELQGAMWVEADTNLPGGESLIRQILYGKRFWKDEFGVEVDNVWLPDVFGYTAALPQIMKKSGLKYFMTQKLSWNEHNPFPYHTFWWKGMDGSAVLTHMLPEESYNSQASAASIRNIEKNYQEKGICDEALVLFGIGDGGGGPGTYHLEKLERLKNFEGLSPTVQRFACDFFHDIEKNGEEYPEWSGELYFENHRGTYTTQARNKKYNRMMEQALRELEFSAVLASLYGDVEYPKEELETVWKEVLLYQFHDIIPGSSIRRVYDESVPRYEILYEKVSRMIHRGYESVLPETAVVNSLSFGRSEYVNIDGMWYQTELPPMGYGIPERTAVINSALAVTDDTIENDRLKVTFQDDGSISSVWDKENGKEIIPVGQSANVLSVYDDEDGDAWNIEVYYDEKTPRRFELTGSRAVTEGIDAVMYQEYVFGNSVITQKIILRQGRNYVEFDTHAEWHETNRMLRTAFPVEVYRDEVTCDIQFGSIKRPTTRNTTWERTQFEICAHKWIDLSGDDYGVALMNDCKYGHKVFGNVMDLALLRSTIYPGEQADQGSHDFRYGLYPHSGNEKDANVEQTALGFQHPAVVYHGTGKQQSPASFLSVDRANIEIGTVKQAEDGNGIIVRMNETNGVSTNMVMTLPEGFLRVKLCDLMEEPEQPAIVEAGKVNLTFKPFEIITILLEQ